MLVVRLATCFSLQNQTHDLVLLEGRNAVAVGRRLAKYSRQAATETRLLGQLVRATTAGLITKICHPFV